MGSEGAHDKSGGLENRDRVAEVNRAGLGLVDEVLAEVDVGGIGGVAAVGGEGAEGFGAVAFAGGLVGGRENAAGTWPAGAEVDGADAILVGDHPHVASAHGEDGGIAPYDRGVCDRARERTGDTVADADAGRARCVTVDDPAGDLMAGGRIAGILRLDEDEERAGRVDLPGLARELTEVLRAGATPLGADDTSRLGRSLGVEMGLSLGRADGPKLGESLGSKLGKSDRVDRRPSLTPGKVSPVETRS